MKIFKDIKWKYVIINIVGILIFIGIFLLYDSQYSIKTQAVEVVRTTAVQQTPTMLAKKSSFNGYGYLLEPLMYIFPFIFFGIVSIIDTIKTKQTKEYAKTTWGMSLILSIIVLISMLINSLIWKITGRVEGSSGGTLSWKTDYVWIFFIGIFLSNATLFIRINNSNIYKNNLMDNE